MAEKFFAHKWEKITAIVFLVLIALVLLAALVINSYWSPVLSKKVKEVVSTSSDGLYTIDFTSAELHVLHGTIVIYNINLNPDTAVYNSRKKLHTAPNNLFRLHIKRLVVSHIHPFTFYFKHKLDIGEIILNNPEINVSYQLNHTKDTVIKNRRTLWQKMSKSLHSLHIGNIILGDIKFQYEDYSGHKVAKSALKEMNVSAHDLLIDSATQTDRSRLLYCKDIIMELNNYSANSSDGLYHYKINHLKLSTLTSRLNIDGLTLTALPPPSFFSKTNSDRFSMHLDSLQLNQFDFLTYHKYRIVRATSLKLSQGTINIFSNPKYTKPTSDRVITFPNAALSALKADLTLDTLRLNQINILYNEYNKKSHQTGNVSFNNTGGEFLNITTNKDTLTKNSVCSAHLTTYFMHRGKLSLNCSFNLADANKRFSVKGTMLPMDLKSLNPATMPLTMVKITSGKLNQFDFDINADKNSARGKIKVEYNDLKVSILKADTAFDNLQKRPVATLFANIFILKHNNPDEPGGVPRSADVTFMRPPDMPFFKYVWNTLLSGIKPAIGLDKKTQQAVVAMVNKQALDKQDRKTRKELRKQRREERREKRAEKKAEKAAAKG